MGRKYKKYLYADVPVPRATAYRHRLKAALQEKADKELNDEELIVESKERQHKSESSISQDMDAGCECSHTTENIEHTSQDEQPMNLDSSGNSDLLINDPCDDHMNALREDNYSDCDANKDDVGTYVDQPQDSIRSWQDEPDVTDSQTLDSTAHTSLDHVVSNEKTLPSKETNVPIDPVLTNTLCKCTSTTVGDALVMCLALGFRHSLSWAALVDTLKLINSLFNDPVVPASKYFFLKHMEKGRDTTVYHLYCPMCEAYLGNKSDRGPPEDIIRCECGQNIEVSSAETFFLSVGLENQLRDLLEKPEITKELDYRFERVKTNNDALEDIYDGAVYKSYSAPGGILSSPLNFSYTFNTDGIPFGKSSKKTIWPIYMTLNELPPKERAKHMLLAGIWVGNKDPNMTIFLKPFVDNANVLSTEGLTWTRYGEKVNSKIIPLCAVVDSVARCKMLNMRQFNSYYGCTMCYQKTERTEKGRRFTVPKIVAPSRTHDGTIKDMIQAHNLRNEKNEQKRVVKGVKGPSPLMVLLYFDLILGMVPDYMHAILLGVTRYHMELLMTSVGKKYYIGLAHKIAVINERLSKIQPPRSITRTPRSLNDMSLWRASEWRSWLIFYCVPCLDGILKPKYIQHMGILSAAVNILLKKSVTREEINTAHTLLVKYVFLFEKYYGASSMVYNVHLLTHLAQGVLNWGPLWTHNCFSFEGQNRHLLQLTKSPGQVARQVVRKFLSFNSLPILCDMYASTAVTLDFCESICDKSFKFLVRSNCGVVLPGKGVSKVLEENEQNCLRKLGWDPVEVTSFQRMIYRHIRYCTSAYAAGKKTNDSVVCVRGGEFGKIQAIVVAPGNNMGKVFVLLREIVVDRKPLLANEHLKLNHIKKVLAEGRLIAVTPEDIDSQCVSMRLKEGDYLSKMPYGCYGD